MKKLLVTVVALVFVLVSAGCGAKESADNTKPSADTGQGTLKTKHRSDPGLQKPADAGAKKTDETTK
ncbi:MAG: hypothetical protein HZB26_23920 [Candidatus Hydrogenedentes bacterium]|nr:hypothetical protein [Candidatus Hydrogenedentota bacterium]